MISMHVYKLHPYNGQSRVPSLDECDHGAKIDALALASMLEARYAHQYNLLRLCGVHPLNTADSTKEFFFECAGAPTIFNQTFSHIGEHCGVVAFVAEKFQEVLLGESKLSELEKLKLRDFKLVQTCIIHDTLKPLDLYWRQWAQSNNPRDPNISQAETYERILHSWGIADFDIADLLHASFLGTDEGFASLLEIEASSGFVRLRPGEWGHKLLIISDAMVATNWRTDQPGGDSYIMTPAHRLVFTNLMSRFPGFPRFYGVNKSTGRIESSSADSSQHDVLAESAEFLVWFANAIADDVVNLTNLKVTSNAADALCQFIRKRTPLLSNAASENS